MGFSILVCVNWYSKKVSVILALFFNNFEAKANVPFWVVTLSFQLF